MGLNVPALLTLRDCLPAEKVLCLGYPDIVATQEQVKKIFNVDVEKTTDFGRWHGKDFPLPDTEELFGKLGISAKYIDVSPSRGVEEVCDLNFPTDLGEFDLVIDGGTIEHCFHIGQALMNAANAVKFGGTIMHTTPMSMINHGFYNACPTLFNDFYLQNGWQVELLIGSDSSGTFYDLFPVKRFQCMPELSIFCIAIRTSEGQVKIPIQSKYALNPALH